MSLNFDIPQYYYFQAGNDYLGSRNGLKVNILNIKTPNFIVQEYL